MEEETPPTPVDGADAGRGSRGGPAALLVEVIAGGLLTGGGGAVDVMLGCYCGNAIGNAKDMAKCMKCEV